MLKATEETVTFKIDFNITVDSMYLVPARAWFILYFIIVCIFEVVFRSQNFTIEHDNFSQPRQDNEFKIFKKNVLSHFEAFKIMLSSLISIYLSAT